VSADVRRELASIAADVVAACGAVATVLEPSQLHALESGTPSVAIVTATANRARVSILPRMGLLSGGIRA